MRVRPSLPFRWSLLACFALVLGLALSSLGQSQPTSAAALTEFQQRQLAEYAPLLLSIQQGKPVAPDLLFQKVYKPIAFANSRDFERNKGVAEDLVRRADEARDKSPDKAAEYVRIAMCYKHYADCNLAVVKAFDSGKSTATSAALDQLLQAEKVLASATGRKVGREWFSPKEAEVRIMAEIARRKVAAADVKR
jgi:hypothetical protein